MRAYRNLSLNLDIPNKIKYYSDAYTARPTETDKEIFDRILLIKGEEYCKENGIHEGCSKSRLWQHGKFLIDSCKAIEEQFYKFTNDNPWVKEYYQYCVDSGIYHNADNKNWVVVNKKNGGELYEKYSNEFTFEHFIAAFSDKRLAMFNELRRKVPFVAGNIVVMRAAYVNKEGHDPYLGTEFKACERIGTVIEILDKTHRWSYSGKGSRLVNVLWSASGQITPVTINSLKLMQRKDKVVDKLVERSYNGS